MTVSTSWKYITTFAATAVLTLGLYGCGGGGGDGPMTGDPKTPEDVDFSDVTTGFMAVAGTVLVAAGQSVDHGDIEFSCAAGGPDCMIEVEVGTDGTVSATSTGGMVTAMNSDAYSARITPTAVDLSSMTAGFMAAAGTVQVAAGQSVVHGDIEFNCAAGGADCEVAVEVNANGDITATSTGGMVTAMNSDAYNMRLTPVAVDLASVTAGFMAGAGTVTIAAGQSVVHGDIEFSCAAGGADCAVIVMVDANGVITATSTGGMVTAMNSTAYDDRLATMQPSPAALANAIDLIASWATRDADGNAISNWWWRTTPFSGKHNTLAHQHKYGENPDVIVSHDDSGQLQFSIAIRQNSVVPPLQTTSDFEVRANRNIDTYDSGEVIVGRPLTRTPVIDGNSEAGWQVETLRTDYDNGGALSVYVATDAEVSDMATSIYETGTAFEGDIVLDEVVPVPANRDYMIVELYDGHSIEGTLDGVSGSFACANQFNCYFVADRVGYQPFGGGISFTPVGGTAETLIPFAIGPEVAANYLAFGYWLYVPEDVTDTEAYDFGVFASGGDPFEAANLAGLIGTATYEGDAAGMYYVGKSSDDPAYGEFTADVSLMADFGDTSATGTVAGTVSNFDWSADLASSLPATVALTSDNYAYAPEGYGHSYQTDENGVVRGMPNIFDSPWRGQRSSWPGGHVIGATAADVDGTQWYGEWHGAFFGNGASPTDHPTSIAGTFTASDYGESGLTGGFGVHRQ